MLPPELRRLAREYLRAQRDSLRAAQRRGDLGPGATRARLTGANARWMILAEHRDRVRAQLDAACERHGLSRDDVLGALVPTPKEVAP